MPSPIPYILLNLLIILYRKYLQNNFENRNHDIIKERIHIDGGSRQINWRMTSQNYKIKSNKSYKNELKAKKSK